MENTIETKTISKLENMHFFIPAYQRGYRWTRQEVRDLLFDVKEFDSKNGMQKYCLQPVVVRKMLDGRWEVIDGQQRLTTIYIFFKVVVAAIPSLKTCYEIEYETRSGSAQFLKNIGAVSVEQKTENIDYYYMAHAWEAMTEWLHEQEEGSISAILKMYPKLHDDTQIIWYQINDISVDPEDIFTKINVGKIPLTNAELIKAIFLRQDNFLQNGSSNEKSAEIYKRQLEISNEWDRIEQSLHEEAFWLFLNNKEDAYGTRIDFIFEILAGERNGSLAEPIVDTENKYFSFLVFDKLFKEGLEKDRNAGATILTNIWEEVGRCHAVFREWYRDSDFYHLIGYLIATKLSTAGEIKQNTKDMKRSQIEFFLKDKVRESVKNVSDLGELIYEKTSSGDTKKIRRVLLLFNIVTMIESNKLNQKSDTFVKFSFDLYKQQKWDIEHIHAIKTDIPETVTLRIEELKERQEKLQEIDPEAVVQIADFMANGALDNNDEYEKFCDEINSRYGEFDVNDISNLTLLDVGTNRSYKNAFFPVKRRTIIERDKGAVFVPVCTKNVFLKFYTANPVNMMRWNAQDREEYLQQMRRMLIEYIPEGEVNE